MPSNDLLLNVLKSFADTIASEYDVADVLYALTDHAVEVLGAGGAGVVLADASGELQFVSANSEPAAQLERAQERANEGPCYLAFASGEEIIVDDLATRHEWPAYRKKAAELGIRSVIGIPMTVGDRRLGALNVYNNELRSWDADDVAAARILASIATSFVLHASQLEEATRLNEQLQHALDARVIIEQAKGLLAGELGISLEAAFEALRHHARSNNATLRKVAEAVVELGLRPQPAPPKKSSVKRSDAI